VEIAEDADAHDQGRLTSAKSGSDKSDPYGARQERVGQVRPLRVSGGTFGEGASGSRSNQEREAEQMKITEIETLPVSVDQGHAQTS